MNSSSALSQQTDQTAAQTVNRMLLSDLEVADLLSCSRATVWRRVADNTLPAPLKIGGMSRFVLSEILERLEDAKAARKEAETT